jgi:hypothetical protein
MHKYYSIIRWLVVNRKTIEHHIFLFGIILSIIIAVPLITMPNQAPQRVFSQANMSAIDAMMNLGLVPNATHNNQSGITNENMTVKNSSMISNPNTTSMNDG